MTAGEHRCKSRQIFDGTKNFCPNFPKLAQKVFVRLLPTNFLPQKLWRPFFGLTSKKELHVLLWKRWAPFFQVKQRWAPFSPVFLEIMPRFSRVLPRIIGILHRFSGILPRFLTNQDFRGCACNLSTPPATPLQVGFGTKTDFMNLQLCGVWKRPVCEHGAIKLTHNCV